MSLFFWRRLEEHSKRNGRYWRNKERNNKREQIKYETLRDFIKIEVRNKMLMAFYCRQSRRLKQHMTTTERNERYLPSGQFYKALFLLLCHRFRRCCLCGRMPCLSCFQRAADRIGFRLGFICNVNFIRALLLFSSLFHSKWLICGRLMERKLNIRSFMHNNGKT